MKELRDCLENLSKNQLFSFFKKIYMIEGLQSTWS